MKLILLSFLILSIAVVYSADGIEYYKNLLKNPLEWVNRPLTKEYIDGSDSPILNFDKKHPAFKSRYQEWKKSNFGIKSQPNVLGRAWQSDSPDAWFNGQSYISDASKLPTSGQASSEPWSSTYWPIQYGILSVRYADNEKNTFTDDNGNSLTWKQSVAKYQEPQDYQKATAAGNVEEYIANYFSPAEKYDLLVGDTAFTLTENNKNQGAPYATSGDVESWMGICHGWAPAAFSVARPQKDVTLTAADGKTKIKFWADDIRGLASLKYAASPYDNIFVGGRCNSEDKDIAKDPASGLVTDYTCFDVNPATWTAIVANRIGVQKKSFVIDATFDLQVWNQPVYSYSLTYFNLLNENQKGDFEKAKIKLSDLSSSNSPVHKFVLKNANKKTASLVGVSMDLVYIAETAPAHRAPGKDREVKVTYVYTLELDENNNMIGGEWLHNVHPDFVWAPSDNAKPLNDEDNKVSSSVTGDISSPEVLSKLTALAAAASNRGEVLDKVISYLVEHSSGARLLERTVSNDLLNLKSAYEKARQEYSDFLSRSD